MLLLLVSKIRLKEGQFGLIKMKRAVEINNWWGLGLMWVGLGGKLEPAINVIWAHDSETSKWFTQYKISNLPFRFRFLQVGSFCPWQWKIDIPKWKHFLYFQETFLKTAFSKLVLMPIFGTFDKPSNLEYGKKKKNRFNLLF